MWSSVRTNTLNLLVVAVLGCLAGQALLVALPVVAENPVFTLLLPLVGVFAFMMAINAEATLMVLLLLRCPVDAVLLNTTIGFLGAGFTLGAPINLILILLVGILIARRPAMVTTSAMSKPWLVFLGVCALACAFAPSPIQAIKFLLNLLTYFLLCLVPFLVCQSEADWKRWVVVLLASSVGPALMAGIDLTTGPAYYGDAGLRIRGSFYHPNVLAFYLVLMIGVTFYVLKSGFWQLSRFWKNTLGMYLIGLIFLLLMTKTRSAWLSCLVLFGTFGLLREKRYLVLAVLAPMLLLLHPDMRGRILEIVQGTSTTAGGYVNSFSWRTELWKETFGEIIKRPIFGYGLASFMDLSRNFSSERSSVGAHNIFVQLWFETGIIGLLAYLAIHGKMLFIFLKNRMGDRQWSVSCAVGIGLILGYLLAGYSDNLQNYLSFNWYWWLFLGLLIRGLEFQRPIAQDT